MAIRHCLWIAAAGILSLPCAADAQKKQSFHISLETGRHFRDNPVHLTGARVEFGRMVRPHFGLFVGPRSNALLEAGLDVWAAPVPFPLFAGFGIALYDVYSASAFARAGVAHAVGEAQLRLTGQYYLQTKDPAIMLGVAFSL